MKKKNILLYPFFFLLFFLVIVQSVKSQPSVCAWRGYVKLNISGTLVDGNTSHVLTSYTNGSQATNGTIESTSYYMINIPGTNGDNITLQVCGVNVVQGFQTWSCDSPGYHKINISINTSANGAVCTYACGCSGGYCNSGSCASSPPTTTTTVVATTAPGGGGGGGGGGGNVTATTTKITTTTALVPKTTTILPKTTTTARLTTTTIKKPKPKPLEIAQIPTVQVIGIIVGVVVILALVTFIFIRFQVAKTTDL